MIVYDKLLYSSKELFDSYLHGESIPFHLIKEDTNGIQKILNGC